jgi:hypothetical protein
VPLRKGPQAILEAARSGVGAGRSARARRRLEKARSGFLKRGDVNGLRELLAAASELPESAERERLVYAAQQNIHYLERAAAHGADVRSFWRRFTGRDWAAVACWAAVVVGAAVAINHLLLLPYISRTVPTKNLVIVAIVPVVVGVVGGVVIRLRNRWGEVFGLATLAAVLFAYTVMIGWPTTNAACGEDAVNDCEHAYAIGWMFIAAASFVLFGAGLAGGKLTLRLIRRARPASPRNPHAGVT